MKPFFIWLLAFLPLVAGAQPSGVLPSYAQMSDPHVTALVKDGSGNLWIGTEFGLNRYNGSTYKYYFHTDSTSLHDDSIRALLADTDNRLWVGTNSGVDLLRDGRVVASAFAPIGRVYSLFDAGDHLIYATRGAIGELNKEGGQARIVYHIDAFHYNHVDRTKDGYIWIRHLTRNRYTILDSRYTLVRELDVPAQSIRNLSHTEGIVFLSSSEGLLCYRENGEPLPSAVPGLSFVDFFVPEGAGAFIGLSGKGIFYWDGVNLIREWSQETLETGPYAPLLLTEDNLWLSPGGKGLQNYYRHTEDHSFPIPSDLSPDQLNKIYADGNDGFLLLTNRVLYRMSLRDKSYQRCHLDALDTDCRIGVSIRDRRGNLWLLYNQRELRCYHRDGLRFSMLASYEAGPSSGLWEDASGNVNLLLEDEVLQVRQDFSHRTVLVNGHPDFWFSVTTISGKHFFLSDDAVWTVNDKLHFTRLELGIHAPSTVCEDKDGTLWIGSLRDGLFHYHPSDGSLQAVEIGKGLVDKCIRSMVLATDGSVWMSRRTDVLRLLPEDGRVAIYSREALRYLTNIASALPDGRVVFGTTEKLAVFQPGLEKDDTPLPLAMDGILVNGSPVGDGPLELNYRQRQISFFYSARNFNPDILPVYAYQLEGYDPDWIFAGQNMRAGYSGLLPGRYTFRVRVQLPSGAWSPDHLAYSFQVKPAPWLSWWAIPLYIILGVGIIVFLQRLFARRRLDKENLDLAQQEKLLTEQMAQERTNFFTNVSHEFRTPLALIYGPVKELAASASLDEKDRKLVSIVQRNSERMVRLTDQLLQFNRSAESRDTLSVLRIDLSHILRKMVENFEYLFRQKSLRVHLDVPEVLEVYCDREKVEKIFFNLLSNAVKYTPDYGSVEIKASLEGGDAVISVADTGIGIAPEKMNRIFNRFERLGEKVGDGLPTGFGVGLHFAQHLATLHKGAITVARNEPLGSVFVLRFPAGKDAYADVPVWDESSEESEKVLETEPVASVSSDREQIMVVEDNVDMREYIRSLLADRYDVVLAGDGEEAWRCIRISAPDLVLSDVMMPYKDGYTLCKELKNDAEYCHLPVVLLTAKTDMENQIHGLELGADAYIAKPFDPAFLVASVDNLLNNRRRMQHLLSQSPAAVEEAPVSARDKAFLEKMYALIEEHLGDEEFNVTTLSLELGMSRTSLFSKLKGLLGQSPQGFLMNYRLNRAMDLLKTGDLNVSEVAYKVGFSTLTGFSRSFKNKFGIPPSSV